VSSLGAYLHVPFCASRCDYCAFATWTDRDHLIGAYLDAVGTEIDRTVAGRTYSSVFVGGGTPTRVPAAALAAVLARIPLTADAEVTIEANPDDVTVDALAPLVAVGLNRVSLGVQSFRPHVLQALGRTHDVGHVAAAVAAARAAGIAELNLDLIYGGVGESVADWESSLTGALALGPDHVSAYALTVEPGTPLADDPARHPDDDEQAEKYVVADEVLTGAGLANYEISNWARPGSECRHNLLYWSQGDYDGFGCAAHSHRDGRRWWNVRTPERYVDLVGRGLAPEAGHEDLDGEARRIEGLQLAVRTRTGVPAAAVPPEVAHLVDREGDRATLTRDGRLLANEVAIRLR
jgi:putative oxygen-independent coproporphyrinogen III oxidase